MLRLAFSGRPDALVFVTPMPARGGLPAGLYQATLRLAGGRRLALKLEPLVSANRPADGDGHGPIVVDGVTGLAVRYYGSPDGRAEPDWADEWRGRSALPQLVAVDVGFAAGDRHGWAPFTTELRLRPAAAGPR